jgi:hypothetical protein
MEHQKLWIHWRCINAPPPRVECPAPADRAPPCRAADLVEEVDISRQGSSGEGSSARKLRGARRSRRGRPGRGMSGEEALGCLGELEDGRAASELGERRLGEMTLRARDPCESRCGPQTWGGFLGRVQPCPSAKLDLSFSTGQG